MDEMSDADVPSLGFVVGSADDRARLSVALRTRLAIPKQR